MIHGDEIVRILDESNKRKLKYKKQYENSTNKYERQMYRNAYLKALDLYSARYQMLLLFGYDVVSDENNNIICIEKITDIIISEGNRNPKKTKNG